MDISPFTFFVLLLIAGLILRYVFGPEKPGYQREWSGQNHAWKIKRSTSAGSSEGVLQLHRFVSTKVVGEYSIELDFKGSPNMRFGKVTASLTVEQARKLLQELDVTLGRKRG